MAKVEAEQSMNTSIEEEEEKREKWVKHYSSSHQILLVGEGDFSFSLSLAQSFGSGSNIIASSLDSYGMLMEKYKQAKSNLEKLKTLGAFLLHEVDAIKMKLHTDLRMRKFDRIIFNFPHAGFYGKEDNNLLIKMHRDLVHGFFRNARGMLRADGEIHKKRGNPVHEAPASRALGGSDGEIHINHKTTAPFCCWNLEELATQSSLVLTECVDFKIEDYPGYNNKRGAGSRSDDPFPLGESSTFKFRFSPVMKKLPNVLKSLHIAKRRPSQVLENPVTFRPREPETGTCFREYLQKTPGYVGTIFNHMTGSSGRPGCNVYSVCEALRICFERYMGDGPGRTLDGYIRHLEELHQLNILSTAWLICLILVLVSGRL